jgi:hypothetical protein
MQLCWNDRASPDQVAAIAAEIDAAGFCRLDGFVGPDELGPLVKFAEAAVEGAGGEYIAFTGAEGFAETAWDRLNASPSLNSLCEDLYRHSTGKICNEQGFYQVFRCLKGESSKGHSLYFHFDSYVITILVPIVIPDSGAPGNFIMFPAARPIRKTYFRNVLDKVFSDFPPMQSFYRRRARSPKSKAVTIDLVPGSAVVFWGYRSLHTNDRSDPDQLRVTALLHFGNPHGRARQSDAPTPAD